MPEPDADGPTLDVSDTVAAETVEGLKRQPADDAPDEQAPEDGAPEDGPTPNGQAPPDGPGPRDGPTEQAPDDGPGLGVDPGEFDSAIGKLWVVLWGIISRLLDEPELKEEKEMAAEAADALGPVARKHIPRQLQNHGPEAVAVAWVSGRIFSKWDNIQ